MSPIIEIHKLGLSQAERLCLSADWDLFRLWNFTAIICNGDWGEIRGTYYVKYPPHIGCNDGYAMGREIIAGERSEMYLFFQACLLRRGSHNEARVIAYNRFLEHLKEASDYFFASFMTHVPFQQRRRFWQVQQPPPNETRFETETRSLPFLP